MRDEEEDAFGLEEVAQETQGYRRLRFGRGDGYS